MSKSSTLICSPYRFPGFPKREICSTFLKKHSPQTISLIPIGTNGDEVFIDKALIGIDEFFRTHDSKRTMLVCTMREWEALLPYICIYHIDVRVIERDFPIFSDIRYSKSPFINFKQANAKYHLIKRYGLLQKTLTSSIIPALKKKFFKKVKNRSNFDSLFGLADNTPLRETYLLTEEREDRCVIAMDVNSMYLHCMTKPFGDPESLKVLEELGDLNVECLPKGLYKVIVSKPKTVFIRRYHPFNLHIDLQKYPFYFSDDDSVELYLSSEEIGFYSKHFSSIELIEGYAFERLKPHPLLKEGLTLFNKKIKSASGPRKNLLKSKLTYLHTVSSPKKYKNIKARSFDEAKEILHTHFNIGSELRDMKDIKELSNRGGSKFFVDIDDGLITISIRDFDNQEMINSYGYEVVSRSRIYMLSLLEKLIEFEGLELCYINVDSFHVSIPTNKKERFFLYFDEYLSQTELGKLKIEAISKHGSWIELGHYYLYSDGFLQKYKIGKTKSPGNDKPVQFFRRLKGVKEEKNMRFIVTQKLRLDNSFTYTKTTRVQSKITSTTRLHSNEIVNESQRMNRLLDEITKSKPLKLSLLEKINDELRLPC